MLNPTTFLLRVDADLHRAVRFAAMQENLSARELITKVLTEYLKGKEENTGVVKKKLAGRTHTLRMP